MSDDANDAAAVDPTLERVRTTLEGLEFQEVETRDGTTCVEVAREELPKVLKRLRDKAGFTTVTFITGVDHLPSEPRFEVSHQLLSVEHQDRVRIKTRVASDDPTVPSCVGIWPGAAFMERECFDLMGVVFEGHPGLKRLMMPETYEYHPLRKDFPQQGIDPDRHYREWDEGRRATWRPEA